MVVFGIYCIWCCCGGGSRESFVVFGGGVVVVVVLGRVLLYLVTVLDFVLPQFGLLICVNDLAYSSWWPNLSSLLHAMVAS